MDLSEIKPLSQWTQQDYYNSALAQGFAQRENEQGAMEWFGPGDDGASRVWRPNDDSDLKTPGDPFQFYNQQLEKAGYAIGGDQLLQWAGKLGLPIDQAAQAIFGQGSQIINDPLHGQVVKAGTFDPNQVNNGWNLPDMEDHSFLSNYGGALMMLPAVGGIAGMGAGAAGGGGAGAADLGWAANLTDMAGGSLAAPAGAGSAYAGLGGAAAAGGGMSTWDSFMNSMKETLGIDPSATNGLDSLTETQQWAKSLGGLNADGSINWSAIDASPTLQSMGSISATVDGAIPFGSSAAGAGTLLDQLKTLTSGGKLPGGSLLQSVFGGGGSTGGSGGAGGTSGGLFGNLIPGLLGYASQKDYQNKLLDLMQKVTDQADPFRSQRPQYQQMLQQSYNDPNFFQNNPALKGLRDMATNDTNRSMAAQGYNMSGNQMMELGNRLQQTQMQYALPFQQQLAQNAGANFNPASGALLATQLGGQAAAAGNNAWGNLGYAFNPITNGVFGNPSNQYQTQQSVGGSGGGGPNIMNSLSNLFSLS